MHVERIKFERTGGFAGIRIAADIEMDNLSKDQKKGILELLDEVDFEELPAKFAGKSPVPDEFVYSIIVQSDKREYKVMAGESAITNDMQPLIELLEGITKSQLRNKG